jgi:hypothetical protein
MYILFLTSNIYMPPKRKKSVRQKQKQRQSQSQRVIVNIGKTTPAKKKRSGRGGLPPPSYQQNLFPPTIIQQQAPNIAVLENQISRLTAKIEQPMDIKQPTTPLGLDTGEKAKNAEAQKLAGEKAEARRPGPTAGNFQSPASKADQRFDNLMTEVDELISQTPTTAQPSLTQPPETAQPSVRPPDPIYSEQVVSDKKPPNMGGFGPEGGGGQPLSKRELKKAKTAREKQRREEDTKEIKRAIDADEKLTIDQVQLVADKKLNIGKKRAKKAGLPF